jgi:transposase-like protein
MSSSTPQRAKRSSPEDASPSPPAYSHKSKRQRYSAVEKLAILQKAATKPNIKVASEDLGVSARCLNRWRHEEHNLRGAVTNRGIGTAKATHQDRMPKLTRVLRSNLHHVEQHTVVSVRRLAQRAMEVRDELLQLYAMGQGFLHDEELKALQAFTGSKSWASKFLKRYRSSGNDAVPTVDMLEEAEPAARQKYDPEEEEEEEGEEEVLDIASIEFVDSILKPLIEAEQRLTIVDAPEALKYLAIARREILKAFAKAQIDGDKKRAAI